MLDATVKLAEHLGSETLFFVALADGSEIAVKADGLARKSRRPDAHWLSGPRLPSVRRRRAGGHQRGSDALMLGVCYYPEHWDEARWQTDARRMAEMGIRYVRIGEFAWSRLEPSRGCVRLGLAGPRDGHASRRWIEDRPRHPTANAAEMAGRRMPDILPVDEQGRVRGFGSRRHYTFSSQTWWRESARIVEAIARRYGNHPVWPAGRPTTNTAATTAPSHGAPKTCAPSAMAAPPLSVRRPADEAWGSVFWSMEVSSFDGVALPPAR